MIVARLRARRLATALDAYAAANEPGSHRDIGLAQLDLLNEGWQQSLARSAVARELRALLGLPARFESWDDHRAAVVSTDKSHLRSAIERAGAAMTDVTWRATGGSSAEPFRFPMFADEAATASLDLWLGRRWLGIEPAAPLFLIWGHAHTLGSGMRGVWAKAKRAIADRALGYTRFSAYLLRDEDMRRGGDMLLASGARYVLGYAVALDRFARVNADRAHDFHALGLTAAIATAEGFPNADSRTVIEACLGCRVHMEYGSMETGPIAYETEQDHYRVFWRHHRLDMGVAAASDGGAHREALITTLTPRAMPLIRYRIGDLIDSDARGDCTMAFSRVIGRSNDRVELPDGAVIHSEAFTHCMRECPTVRSFQVVVGARGTWPTIVYAATGELQPDELSRVRSKLARVHPGLAVVPIQRRDQLEQSVAGKHKMVVTQG